MPWFLWMVVLGGAVAAAVSLASRARLRKARAAWAEAAQRLGFRMVAGGHRGLAMAGDGGDLPVSIDVEQRGSGDGSETVTRYRIELPPLGVDIDLRKKSGWHGVLQLLGAEDVTIDHTEFDSWFKLSTNNQARTRRYLNPQRVAAMLELSGNYPNVVLADDELRLEANGVASNADRIVATAHALMDAAQVLVVPESETQYLLLGDRVPEAGGRREELEKIHDAIDELVDTHPEDDPLLPAGDATRGTTPAPAQSTAADQVATDLFGDRQLGFESQRRFDDRYRDTPITWTGSVQREGGPSAARVLGDEPTLVEVNVATLEDDLYGTSTVDAVVAIPAGTPMPERGASITFSGTLVGIDPLTKDLYVADGRIE